MRLLEDTLSEEFLSEKIQEGDTAVMDVDNEGKVQVLLGDKLELAQN
jgi:ATP-dependent Clp protease ATP-binding subunit ClpC